MLLSSQQFGESVQSWGCLSLNFSAFWTRKTLLDTSNGAAMMGSQPALSPTISRSLCPWKGPESAALSNSWLLRAPNSEKSEHYCEIASWPDCDYYFTKNAAAAQLSVTLELRSFVAWMRKLLMAWFSVFESWSGWVTSCRSSPLGSSSAAFLASAYLRAVALSLPTFVWNLSTAAVRAATAAAAFFLSIFPPSRSHYSCWRCQGRTGPRRRLRFWKFASTARSKSCPR